MSARTSLVSNLLLLLLSLMWSTTGFAQTHTPLIPHGPPPTLTPGPDMAPDRFLVRFAPAPQCALNLPDCWPEARQALLDAGVESLASLVPQRSQPTPLNHIYIAQLNPNTPIPHLGALQHLPGVVYAEPDYVGHGGAVELPDDTAFQQQWGLEQTSDADIDAPLAWALERGDANTVIAVLDTGGELSNPDFSGRLLSGTDTVNTDDNPSDDHGHGTNIAGLAAASSFNGFAIAGVCGECSILPVKVLDDQNFGFYSWWIKGIEFAVNQNVDVINLSLGGVSNSQSLQDAVQLAYDNNIVVVVATMNDGLEKVYYPAGFPTTIAVGATNDLDQRAIPFIWGGGSNYGDHIHLVAPGNRMLGPDGATWSGTSQATAIVSGAVGLLLSAKPDLTPDEVLNLLIETAEDRVGPIHEDIHGFDIYYGHGRLNAHRALEALALFQDNDEDGYSEPVDCDDTRPEIHPEAPEIPDNNIDDDCNPNTNEDDLDGDGFSPPEDCNDTLASVNPDARERPGNGIDDDCNPNTSDEMVPDVVEPPPGNTPGCCTVIHAQDPSPWGRALPVGLALVTLLGLRRLRRRE